MPHGNFMFADRRHVMLAAYSEQIFDRLTNICWILFPILAVLFCKNITKRNINRNNVYACGKNGLLPIMRRLFF